ncbi:MAG: thioredoxin domain-containing protein [Chloroflexi bacterium]|nr:thioredoxin domain-containing protein [Chloroflexota bacterium]
MAKSSSRRRRSSSKSSSSSRSRRSQSRNQTPIVIGIAVAAVVLVVGVIAATVIPGGQAAAVSIDYSGLEQSIDREYGAGAIGFSLGDPNAPVTLVEYSDFSCPHCNDLSEAVHQLIEDYVRDGQLRIVYKPVAFVNPTTSTPAARAAVCAAEQGVFWEYHDVLWGIFRRNGPNAYTPAIMTREFAELSGVSEAEFEACYSSPETIAEIEAVLRETQTIGVTGTPTLFVNGQTVGYRGAQFVYGDLVQAIDAELQ